MKKLVFCIGAVAIIAIAAFNLNISSRGESFSDIALSNIEALARGEDMPSDCGPCWVDYRCKVGNITWTYAYPKSQPKPCDC